MSDLMREVMLQVLNADSVDKLRVVVDVCSLTWQRKRFVPFFRNEAGS